MEFEERKFIAPNCALANFNLSPFVILIIFVPDQPMIDPDMWETCFIIFVTQINKDERINGWDLVKIHAVQFSQL